MKRIAVKFGPRVLNDDQKQNQLCVWKDMQYQDTKGRDFYKVSLSPEMKSQLNDDEPSISRRSKVNHRLLKGLIPTCN
jgi:hypothetical protein